MNEKINGTSSPSGGIGRDDIIFILSRHKWKIGIISAVSILTAAAVYYFWPLPYRSEARLLIKYVVDSKTPSQMSGGNSRISSPDDRGDQILNNELENLGSFDIAMEVAKNVGASNLVAKTAGGNELAAAAGLIRRNLLLDVPKHSSVIHLIFQHKDPNVVKPVLDSIIQEYYKKHIEIHRDLGQFGDFLTRQTDQLHTDLLRTEEKLREAKTNVGIISIEDTKKSYGEQMARIQTSLLEAEAELAERQAAAAELAKLTHAEVPTLTNSAAASTNDAPVPSDKLAEYKRLSSLIDKLSTRQQELLVQFTSENSWVKQVGEQIAENEKLRQKLEETYPGLITTKAALPRLSSASGNDSRPAAQMDLTAELARVAGLQAKIKLLMQQVDQIQNGASKVYASEGSISDLQRRYYLQETQYNYFSMSLEQSRIDEALGASRVSNISEIQAPTPPGRDYGKLQKISLGIMGAGLALAFGLAFLIELYLDQSIKRPVEIETKLGLPLFISIPRLNLGKPRPGLPSPKVPLLKAGDGGTATGSHSEKPGGASSNGAEGSELVQAKNGANGHEIAPWDPRYVLRPFCRALRDNLITFFEINNLTHKPKLVAVTSCSQGTGVSTIAAGLAASLSETGEGNVLLVNMNQAEDGGVQQFYKGRLTCGLDDALEIEKRDHALVQENLYVANETQSADSFPVILPKRFKNLVPRLRASDYDYIIFDMPEVSQISPTQRLARFMDMVLMVVESEKTSREAAKTVGSVLVSTKTNVAVVLNKTRDTQPERS